LLSKEKFIRNIRWCICNYYL